jgi:hypothetical protein
VICVYTSEVLGKVLGRDEEKQRIIVTVKSSPVTGLEWPGSFQEVKVPRFHDKKR